MGVRVNAKNYRNFSFISGNLTIFSSTSGVRGGDRGDDKYC